MGSEWREARLEDVCEGVFDCPHSTPELTSTGPYVVRSQDMRSGVLRLDNSARVSESTYRDRIARAEPRHGDLLYSREGTYFGIAAEVPPKTRLCLGQRMVLIRPNPALVDGRFLLYWLNSPVMAAHTQARRDGSVAERLNLPTIRSLPVPVPPLWEQRHIAGILGALDDKIELNRRMSQNLESMARVLFKSWFVDFDPVGAKAQGKRPGLASGADVFPDSFEESDLGKIPRGWTIRPIGELADVVGGSTPDTAKPEYWLGGRHHWATPKDLSGISIPLLLDTERRITDAGLAQIGSGLLPRGTVLLSSRAPIGYLAIAEVPLAVNQGFIAMKPTPLTSSLFLLFWASVAHDSILSRANGSTFLEISKTNFRPIPVVTPPIAVVRAFDEAARPLYDRMVESVRESRAVRAMRDALLPKLTSGLPRPGID